MNDDEERLAREARERREAELILARIKELYEHPVQGKFDAEHLKEVHRCIFQDLPEHRPGVMRDRTEDAWVKHRALEGQTAVYDVHYARTAIEEKVSEAVEAFGGPKSLKGLAPEVAAPRIARLYGDLDFAHAFYEGNSRTLREFTREVAAEAGFDLNWTRTNVTARERNQLYLARDLAVMERAFPDLTPQRAMQTNDRAEYEASYVIAALTKAVGPKPLEVLITDGLQRSRDTNVLREPGNTAQVTPLTSEPLVRDSAPMARTPPKQAATQTARAGLDVMDRATGKMAKLADFFMDFIAGPAPEPQKFTMDPAEVRLQQQQRVAEKRIMELDHAALARIQHDIDKGANISASDLHHLTDQHKLAIKQFGDNGLQQVLEEERRRRQSERER